MAAIIVFDITV